MIGNVIGNDGNVGIEPRILEVFGGLQSSNKKDSNEEEVGI